MGLIGTELSAPSNPLADLQLQIGGCSHHSYLKIFSVLGVTKPWNSHYVSMVNENIDLLINPQHILMAHTWRVETLEE